MKYFILGLLSVCLSVAGRAQELNQVVPVSSSPSLHQHGFGVKGGFTLQLSQPNAQSTVNEMDKILPGYGFNASAFYYYNHKRLFIGSEIGVITKGYRQRTKEYDEMGFVECLTGEIPGTKTIHRMIYLNVPVLAGVKVKQFQFYAGPEIGVQLNGITQFKYPGNINNDVTQEYGYYSTEKNLFDAGMVAGISYIQPIKKVALLYDLRFGQSFNTFDFNARHRYLSLSVGIML